MEGRWRIIVWPQFGAAIDMLRDAIIACPSRLWRHRMWREGEKEAEYSELWNVAHHALFWLDLYLSGSVEGFAPPPPFGMDELDPRGLLPERPYTREELLTYLEHCRRKAHTVLQGLNEEEADKMCVFPWGEVGYLELQLYNMRHVQEHAAQISLLLGQETGSAPGWVTRASPAAPAA
jgi:hypothetical protein